MSKRECIFTTFLKSRISVVLIGGVLSALALALIPHHAYAVVSITSNDLSGSFVSKIQAGCSFKTYDMSLENGSGIRPYLGYNFGTESLHNCGYRYVNNHISWYDDNSSWNSSIAFSNGTNTNTFSVKGGYNILNSWDSDVISDYGVNTYNAITRLSLEFNNSSPLILNSSNSSGVIAYTPFLLEFDNSNGDLGISGTLPRFMPCGLGSVCDVYKSNGDSLSSSDSQFALHLLEEQINSSLNMTCGASPVSQELLSPDFTVNEDHCYIYGTMLLNPEYKYYIYTMGFGPALSSTYNYSENGSITTDDYKFNFLFANDLSYYNAGSAGYVDYLNLTHFNFQINMCITESECDLYGNFADSQVQNRINNLTGGFDSSGSQSLFMSWFDVFAFNFTFPFRFFFSSFTNDQCVDIPIIGGMLNNPNAQYCSWWPSSIRNVLTPVFSFFSIMLLTGFIFSFLKGHSDPISVGSNDPSENSQYHHPKGFPL